MTPATTLLRDLLRWVLAWNRLAELTRRLSADEMEGLCEAVEQGRWRER